METTTNSSAVENSADVDHIHHQHQEPVPVPVPVPDASNSNNGYGEVLSEYPEAKMTSEQQNASLGETYSELLKRLDEALLWFVEGPPFTLQRLCEILLASRSIYPNLSKLAFALEKNLLVTSTLTVCTDPYLQTLMQSPEKSEKTSEELQLHSHTVQNGFEPMVGDRDEVMTDVEHSDIDDEMTIDMEALDEIVGSSETNSTATGNSFGS